MKNFNKKDMTREHLYFIADLIDEVHPNQYIIDKFKEEYDMKLSSSIITEIRKGFYLKRFTSQYNFAKLGYPDNCTLKRIKLDNEGVE
ncbi:hypothetical protein [Staphylococcus phage vB_StaM_SA1]|nr:hypothetical protein [Staphylococcus phage vB_StaM_SA1]